jgi:adenine-specific DNA-methyltransferase
MGADTFKKKFLLDKILFKKNKNNEWRVYTKNIVGIDLIKLEIMKNLITFTTTSKGSNQFTKLNLESKFNFPKPSDLISYLIELHPNKNAVVFDPFMGSGTLGEAVLELNKTDGGDRIFIGNQLEYSFDKITKK